MQGQLKVCVGHESGPHCSWPYIESDQDDSSVTSGRFVCKFSAWSCLEIPTSCVVALSTCCDWVSRALKVENYTRNDDAANTYLHASSTQDATNEVSHAVM